MNILIVHNYYKYPGGEDSVVENEKRMLEKHGHNVILYTRDNKETAEYRGITGKTRLALEAVYSGKTYEEIFSIIRNEKIRIVHVHNTLSLISPAVYYAAKSLGVPVVQTIHNFRLLCLQASFYRKGAVCERCLKKGMGCGVLRRCYRHSFFQSLVCMTSIKFNSLLNIYKYPYYICTTQFNEHKLAGAKFINKEKIFIKPHFIPSTENQKELLSIPKSDYYIYVGRLEEIKGIMVLINAWKLMGDKAPKLKICGTGELEDAVKQEIEDKRICNIEMLGFVEHDRVRQLMAAARALIFPSQVYETFGMVIAESYSVGTPVIASRLGNAGLMVKENETGFRFIHYGPAFLKEAVEKMEALSEEERKEMNEKAFQVYFNNFTEEKNYMRLMEIYKSIS